MAYQLLQHFSVILPRPDPINYWITFYQIADDTNTVLS